MMLDPGKHRLCGFFSKELHRGVLSSPDLFRVCINDMIDSSSRSRKGGSNGG